MFQQSERVILRTLLRGTRSTFLSVLPDTKVPLGSRSTPALSTPPAGIGYGVRPRGRLFVIDLDTDIPLSAQHDYFSGLLGCSTRDTLRVRTPSGGEHVYLFLYTTVRSFVRTHGGFPVSLRSPGVDADIRSSASPWGYVMGPGSFVGGREYRIIDRDVPIATVGEEGALRFLERFAPGGGKESEVRRDRSSTISSDADSSMLSERVSRITLSDDASFHARRAQVFGYVGCCASFNTMRHIWGKLDIDRDTYRDSGKMRVRELRGDFERLVRKFPFKGHGCFCPERRSVDQIVDGLQKLPALSPVSLKQSVLKRSVPVSYGSLPPDARVISFRKVFEALVGKVDDLSDVDAVPRLSQRVRDAFMIVFGYFSPLVCAGAQKSPVSYAHVEERLGLSRSRIRDAMRLLREKRVLRLVNKQAPGRSAVYMVPRKFRDDFLTKYLRNTHAATSVHVQGRQAREPVVYDHFSGQFIGVATGGVLYRMYDKRFAHKYHNIRVALLSDCFRLDFVQNYMRKTIEQYNSTMKYCRLVGRPVKISGKRHRVEDVALRYDMGEHLKRKIPVISHAVAGSLCGAVIGKRKTVENHYQFFEVMVSAVGKKICRTYVSSFFPPVHVERIRATVPPVLRKSMTTPVFQQFSQNISSSRPP